MPLSLVAGLSFLLGGCFWVLSLFLLLRFCGDVDTWVFRSSISLRVVRAQFLWSVVRSYFVDEKRNLWRGWHYS